MAFMLEFSDFLRPPHRSTASPPSPLPQKEDGRPSELMAALEMMSGGSILECQDERSGKTRLGFTMEGVGGVDALLQVEIGGKEGEVRLGATILQGGSFCRLKSS